MGALEFRTPGGVLAVEDASFGGPIPRWLLFWIKNFCDARSSRDLFELANFAGYPVYHGKLA